jgi:hypothetical protein
MLKILLKAAREGDQAIFVHNVIVSTVNHYALS